MSTIRATVHQPVGVPTGYDLRTAQDNQNKALAALQNGPLAAVSASLAGLPMTNLINQPPGSSTDPGNAGDWYLDTSFLYLCLLDPALGGPPGGTPVWRRISLGSF